MPRLRCSFPVILLAATFAAVSPLSGCAGSNAGPEPIAKMLDTDAHSRTRLRAIDRTWDAVAAGEIEREQAREMLKKVAWSRSTYWSTRVAAIDALMRDTENLDDTRAMFALLVPTERVGEVLDRIGRISVQQGWTNVAPAFVRAWDRNTEEVRIDDDRPEPRVLRALFADQTLTTTLFQVFRGDFSAEAGVRFSERDRRAAWGLLVRTATDDREIQELLSRIDSADRDSDPLMWAVAQGAMRFGAIPQTGEQVAWVERLLLRPENSAFIKEAESVVGRLSEEQRQSWQLRHLSGAVWASRFAPERLTATRAELLGQLEREISGREHFFRDRTDTAWQGGESLSEWRGKMVWGDVLLALIAAEAVRTRSSEWREVHADLFAQADADHTDTSTEYGGITVWDEGGRLDFRLFPPRANSRFGDDRFVASREMIEASDGALFHYHFHVMRQRNADYAGPSHDDFEYARLQGRSCLVLTFITENRLNVDYYQPGGVRVDLGTIDRP